MIGIGRMALTVLVALAIKGGVALMHHSIGWLWCVVIAVVFVYGGFLFISGDVID
jgi:hypothetical protein